MAKYLAGAAVAIAVTEYVRVQVPLGSLVAVLTLAELYQANGRHDEAIGLLQQLVELDPDPALVLSPCDLYAETGAWAEIIDVAAGTRNDDDISLQVRLFQAEALERQGMNDAALEAYKDALRSTKRDGELIKAARYGRGRLYLQLGKKAQGRKDLERVYAADPHYRDVADLLTAA
jgi:tetratricopeptide (TPR) repeat protein